MKENIKKNEHLVGLCDVCDFKNIYILSDIRKVHCNNLHQTNEDENSSGQLLRHNYHP